jgi:hypothetical protein
VTPATVPGKPTGVTATSGSNQATVHWTAPADDGGSAITTYTVTATGGATKTVTGDKREAVVTGLTNGSTYTFTVVATNAKGDSAPSDASAPLTLPVAPDAPTNVTATPGNAQATVTWTAPTSDGGATVTKYVVTPSGGAAPVEVTGNPAPTTAAVTGLTNGTSYTFTVVAQNSAGSSVASGPSAAVTPSTTPTAPQAVTATAGDRTLHVIWASPASTGGSAVTHYLVSLNGGAPTVLPATAGAADFSGLVNGTSYTASVVAQNANGSSPATSAAPVVPKYVVSGTIARSASAVTYGGAVRLSGRFTRSGGTALAGRTVRLYAKTYPATTYRLIATTTTTSTGTWAVSTKPARVTSYYAVFPGDAADRARTTSALAVAVRYAITRVSPTPGTSVRAGTITFKARVAPVLTGAPGVLLQRRSDGSVVSVASAKLSSTGYLVMTRRLARGTYVFAFRVSAYKGCSTTATSFFTLKVT